MLAIVTTTACLFTLGQSFLRSTITTVPIPSICFQINSIYLKFQISVSNVEWIQFSIQVHLNTSWNFFRSSQTCYALNHLINLIKSPTGTSIDARNFWYAFPTNKHVKVGPFTDITLKWWLRANTYGRVPRWSRIFVIPVLLWCCCACAYGVEQTIREYCAGR